MAGSDAAAWAFERPELRRNAPARGRRADGDSRPPCVIIGLSGHDADSCLFSRHLHHQATAVSSVIDSSAGSGTLMTLLWLLIALPAIVALCWWDQLLTMALTRRFLRRDDDKAARQRGAND